MACFHLISPYSQMTKLLTAPVLLMMGIQEIKYNTAADDVVFLFSRICPEVAMLRWPADEELNELIRRYYAGEAGLWETIRRRIDDELRQREMASGAYHIRLR